MVTISDKVFSISDEAYEMVLHTIERSGLDPWLTTLQIQVPSAKE